MRNRVWATVARAPPSTAEHEVRAKRFDEGEQVVRIRFNYRMTNRFSLSANRRPKTLVHYGLDTR
jgi:hypothetical protein